MGDSGKNGRGFKGKIKLTGWLSNDCGFESLDTTAWICRGVDLVQVNTSFEIGRHIVEHEQHGKWRATYGQEVLNRLSEKLIFEFGKGFSRSNLEYMRRFYLAYAPRRGISQTESGKSRAKAPKKPFTLSWSHYVFLTGIKETAERDFYEIEADCQGWNIRELRRQFDSSLYERLALSRNKKDILALAKKGQAVEDPKDILKEPLVLEFLGLDDQVQYSESDLESAILSRIEHFLLELGKGFLFEARQKRFTLDGDHFFVDLVFYNRLLHCYVLIDLKIGKLTHQDLGQMQMYVNAFDRHVKAAKEKPTIGILLCKQKSDAMVEITLPKGANVHAREYSLYLPGKEELKKKLMEWAKMGKPYSPI